MDLQIFIIRHLNLFIPPQLLMQCKRLKEASIRSIPDLIASHHLEPPPPTRRGSNTFCLGANSGICYTAWVGRVRVRPKVLLDAPAAQCCAAAAKRIVLIVLFSPLPPSCAPLPPVPPLPSSSVLTCARCWGVIQLQKLKC